MAEKYIPLLPEKYYHIYNHANGKDNLFGSDANYYLFLEKYAFYIAPVAHTFAYCLLPNHFHFFIKVKSMADIKSCADSALRGLDSPSAGQTLGGLEEKEPEKRELSDKVDLWISKQFSNMFNGYTQAFNKWHGRKGNLFQHRFKRKPVYDVDYFVRLIHYIHHNPIKHGFVKLPDDWKFSSYHSYVANKHSKINKEESLKWFGDVNKFKTLHTKPPDGGFFLDLDY